MLRIREIKKEELKEIEILEKRCFVDAWSQTALEETWERKISSMYGAFQGEKVIGYCIVYQVLDEIEIERIAVDLESRKRGVAGLLLETVKEDAAKREVKRILLEVREGNFPARALYEKKGFVVDGKRKEFYRDPKEDAILMSFSLKEISTTSQ